MVSAEGGTDEDHGTPLVKRLRWRSGWWGPLFGLVVMVGSGHLLGLAMTLILGEAPPREFSLSGFVLVWVLTAGGVSLLEWWEQRSGDRRLKPPRPQWRDDAPRGLVMASSVASACFLATWWSGYSAAFDGELKLLWADALAASAFALAAIVRRFSERYRMPEDSEAAVGGL